MKYFLSYRSYNLCQKAVTNSAWALQFVPDEIITMELCEIAIQNNPKIIPIIPDIFKTKEILSSYQEDKMEYDFSDIIMIFNDVKKKNISKNSLSCFSS